ncbi:MAG TPA: exodeoxyribonuclease VII large subunit [Candidatus Limnocylindrales bacterium]|nr:exodeoxyribonuclease VII large subunit [Candidatus Limnocylindrales bacterium]
MMELPNNVFTVATLTAVIQDVIESEDLFSDVWVEGEISNFKSYSSGHWYFTLKEGSIQLKGVMWRSFAGRQEYTPRDGEHVRAHGAIKVYPDGGTYQIQADRLRLLGVGDLFRRLEETKARLRAEGLFDDERKRPLPFFPRCIGVVTSAESAAFQDVLNVLHRRYPLAHVVLSPTLVQGESAPESIVRAVGKLNARDDIDVILVCRGGGSIEDLWAFNDERVVRCVAASRLPVISGVGHETDFMLIDFAADVRAPTPSAAAEMLTPDIADLQAAARSAAALLEAAFLDDLRRRGEQLAMLAHRLERASPASLLAYDRQRVDGLTERLGNALRAALALRRERLNARAAALDSANPSAILARGYALVHDDATGARITSAQQGQHGARVTLTFHDGARPARLDPEETA